MTHRLRVASVSSSSRLSSALSPGQAGEHGALEDGVLTVDDRETAEELVDRYPNVAWLDDQPDNDDVDAGSDDEICGYEKPDGSTCQRAAGWGRDADTGPCKDHVED